MTARLTGIIAVLFCTSIAWMFLGRTIEDRTYHSDDKLRAGVASIWGAPQEQNAPSAAVETAGRTTLLPLDASRINVALDLEYRQKGLLWYSTYRVDFAGLYTFRNTTSEPQQVTYRLRFPAEHAVYDGLVMEINGRSLPISSDKQGVTVAALLGPNEQSALRVAYHSRGLDAWRYRLSEEDTQVRDFTLNVKTNFKQIDFPLTTLAPTTKVETPEGWDLAWRYTNLISGFQIGVTMPQKLQPGPLAGQISYFAPVSLLIFFFLMFVLTTQRSIDLHPMNYFFLAAAFFSFHLLLAYLVDQVSIHVAFLICSVVSIFLVVSYLRLVVGPRFAFLEAAGAQFVYLVLFSYAFFLQGFTGLSITLGCIVTLFVVMQMTAHIHWPEQFPRRNSPGSPPLRYGPLG